MKSSILVEPNNTKFIAHRGLSGIESENTIAAFLTAGNRNYYGIESDVHIASDGKFVMIHDNNTKRVSGVDLPVEETEFNTLRSLSLYDKDGCERIDLRIPSLSEYLKVCKNYNKIAVLEIKNRVSSEKINEIVGCVCNEYCLENTMFISFDFDNLVCIRNISPSAKIQFLYEKDVDTNLIERLKEFKFDIDIFEGKLNKETIDLFHENGILVNCWTCDDEHRASQLIDWNVDFITTNILQPKTKEI